jgi:hypothetical protein
MITMSDGWHPRIGTGNLVFKIFRQEYGDKYFYAGLESTVPFSH